MRAMLNPVVCAIFIAAGGLCPGVTVRECRGIAVLNLRACYLTPTRCSSITRDSTLLIRLHPQREHRRLSFDERPALSRRHGRDQISF
jgi:hypothetical protein